MRRTALFIGVIVLLFATLSWAQMELPWTTRVFKIRYASLDSMAKVVGMFGGKMSTSEELRAITWTGPESLLPGIEQALRQLDVPPEPIPNVELTFYLLSGSKGGASKNALPADLQGVGRQLTQLFGFSSFSLLETAFLRASDRAHISGTFQMPSTAEPASYGLDVRGIRLREDDRSVSIGMALSFHADVPVPNKGEELREHAGTHIETEIEFRDGQKAVVGKATIDGSSDTFFLVVAGHLVE